MKLPILTWLALFTIALVCECQDGAPECPSLEGCSLSCRNGFQTDADECDTCACKEGCPSVICALFCENGFKVDSDGCPICECDDTEQCQSLTCDNTCPFGYTIGGDGCMTCDCNENPCDCDEDEECVINANLEWTCEKSPGENEECEFEEEDDNERSGSSSNSKSSSTSNSKSSSNSNSNSGSRSNTTSDSTNSGTTGSKSRNGSLSNLPDRLLRLLSSRNEREERRENSNRARGASAGAASRNIFRNIQVASDSCQQGFYCKRTNDDKGVCTSAATNGSCLLKSNNPERDCDDNGFYNSRVCDENDDETECVCVNPETGEIHEETRVTVTDDSEKPNCIDLVYGTCQVSFNRRSFRVGHGRTYFDRCNCQECRCYFGQLFCDAPQNGCNGQRVGLCSTSPDTPVQSCTLDDGTVVPHGGSTNIDCNRCFCRNGRLICSRYQCDGETDEDECDRCSSERVNKVCGPNGRTYPNLCTAVHCAGWDPDEVTNRTCSSINPCIRFPCDSGEICLRRGGVSCLAQGGCQPSDVRVCVRITRLPCNFSAEVAPTEEEIVTEGEIGSGDIDPSDTAVCGSDGNSYPAICHVIPNYVSVHVLHAGRCDNINCRGGTVCGTDGETYENVCVLRSLSSNARVDYQGECLETDGTFEEYCQAVIDEGLCPYSSDNCDNLVQPSVGCCPICGSAISLLLDIELIQEAALVDPSLRTLDDLVENLLQADFFGRLGIFERCRLEASLTDDNQQLEIVFTPTSPEHQEFCVLQANATVQTINRLIENAGTSTGRKRQSDDNEELPSTYVYVVGAVNAQSDDDNMSGAVTTAASTGLIAVSIIILVITAMY